MGYNLKSPWSLTELQNQNISNIPRELSQIIGHRSIDLNQGNSVSLEENLVEKLGGARNYLMESSSSGSSKRIRTPANGTIIPSCLVDGCTSDLSKGRDYHRRHKVCEIHSKTPKVYIKGQEQRFCQQCSRFHSLVEFDEGKRSCRKRLDGHNRRRRKPQPDSMSVNSSRLFPNQQGARYLHFGGSEIFSSSAASSGWAAAVKPDDEPMLYPNRSSLNFSSGKHIFSGSVSNSFRGTGKQFPFSQCSSSSLPEESVCQSILDASSTLGSSGNNQKMYSDGANQVIDSNCALSLLSSPPVETREIGLSHMVHPNLNTTSQSLIPTLNFSNLGMENGSVDSVLVSDGSSNPDLRGHNLFQIGPDGSSASSTHQTLSFSWE